MAESKLEMICAHFLFREPSPAPATSKNKWVSAFKSVRGKADTVRWVGHWPGSSVVYSHAIDDQEQEQEQGAGRPAATQAEAAAEDAELEPAGPGPGHHLLHLHLHPRDRGAGEGAGGPAPPHCGDSG